jgi:type IV secretory pathway VirD2 relaxase
MDEDFKPRLGRIRSAGGKAGRTYLRRVLHAVARAGGRLSGGGGFTGRRIGRGSGVARVLADRHTGLRARRAVVKARIVRLGKSGLAAAGAHLRYIQRDGVTRDGQPGQLYDATGDRAEGRAFLARADGDRHQFRFIVSPEDGAEYADLKPLTRRLMTQMETDLGSRLDWVAVDHYNTGHPHTHIILRGKDEHGRDLVIAREYITCGLRERAVELVTLDLGPRTDREIENRLRAEIEHERLTGLDRRLLAEADGERVVTAADPDPFRQTLRAGRLRKLERMGLAEETAPGRWRLADGLAETLTRMGERGDIIRTMQRDFADRGRTWSPADTVIADPTAADARTIIGRVVARGLADEIEDRHYLIVDGTDGRTHWVDIGKGEAEPTPEGSIVALDPRHAEPRTADRTVATIAAAHGGRYDVDIHLALDPRATAEFAEAHVRRLEAMRRRTGSVERQPDGTWIIAPDHLERAAAYERLAVRDAPVTVRLLSVLPLERQVTADGATWLDHQLVADAAEPLRDSGFGRETREALTRRRQWLIEQGLAREDQDRLVTRANLLAILRRRELTRVAGQLSGDLGLPYAEAPHSGSIAGKVRQRLDLASGRFAVIENSREFTLVPWRPVLERNLGKAVAGIVRGESISWTVGRQRGIGIE